jgi:hypothetical protein
MHKQWSAGCMPDKSHDLLNLPCFFVPPGNYSLARRGITVSRAHSPVCPHLLRVLGRPIAWKRVCTRPQLGNAGAECRWRALELGGGCSATAVRGGFAVATTAGFSPLEGLMMGTRCGSIDPGILLHLERQGALSHAELNRALNHSSGLLGVSGVSADLAQIEVAAGQGNKRAALAFDMFADCVRSLIGAPATTLGGVDALTLLIHCSTDLKD